MEKQQLLVDRRATYYTEGSPLANEWWLLLHGYAQRADELLNACEDLVSENRFLIAPEGLSHFYREGFSGEIGASWMTKHERESEIKDYVAYLNKLVTGLQKINRPKKVNLMGFSQGTATATRWLAQTDIKIENAVIYAGSPALEIPPKDLANKARHFWFLWGDQDKFIKAEQAEKLLDFWKGSGIELSEIKFKGRHRVTSEALQMLQKEILTKTQP